MKCGAYNANGEPCGAEAVWDSPWCLMHQPNEAGREFHREMSRKGGSAKLAAKPVDVAIDLSTPEGVVKTAQAVAEALASGRIDRARANSLSYLIHAAIASHKAVDNSRRIRKIERILGVREDDDDTQEHGNDDA